MDKTNYTRTEIYELLWLEPTTKVAKRLGISDVGLAKWCRQYDIPKPKLGYWAKRSHGVAVPDKPGLPELSGRLPEPTISVGENIQSAAPVRDEPIKSLPLFRGKTFDQEIEKTFRTEHDECMNKYGRWIADAGFSVEVAPASIYKARLILQTLTDALLAKGFEFGDYKGRYRERVRTSFCQVEERIVLKLYEPSKRLGKPIQKKESWTHSGRVHSYIREIEFQGAGRLEIHIDHPDTYPTVIIRENPKRTLEETLGLVIEVVDELCEEAKEIRRQREIDRAEAEKERKRLADIKWSKDVEAWKWGQLEKAAGRWNELSVIREFVQAMKTSAKVRRKNKGLKEWVSWAEEQINARDPVYKVASGMSLPGQNEPERPNTYGEL